MQQITKTRMVFLTLFGYMGFLTSWGIGQILAEKMGESVSYFPLLFFYIVFMTIFGIAVPFLLSKKYGFRFHNPSSKRQKLIGFTALILVFIAGTFNPDALPILIDNPPSVGNTVKYLLLFLPMALGICLQSFFLIPRTVEAVINRKRIGIVLAVIISALSYGFGFYVDTLFTDIEFASTMVFLGVFFGVGSVFTRSLYFTYPVLFIVMLTNTLAEAKYFEEPWGVLVIGFMISFTVVILFRVYGRK
jgi:hypothetical protein